MPLRLISGWRKDRALIWIDFLIHTLKKGVFYKVLFSDIVKPVSNYTSS